MLRVYMLIVVVGLIGGVIYGAYYNDIITIQIFARK